MKPVLEVYTSMDTSSRLPRPCSVTRLLAMDLNAPDSRATAMSYSSPEAVSSRMMCQLRNFLLSNSCSLSSMPLREPEMAL